jgi:hypothetical protein
MGTTLWLGNIKIKMLRHGWDDNTKMNVGEMGCEHMKWIQMAKDSIP